MRLNTTFSASNKLFLWFIFLSLSGMGSAHSSKVKDVEMIKLVFVLKVTDEKKYQTYRDKIKPLMKTLNIFVLNEYRIGKVVHSHADKDEVNFMAIFSFPDEETKKAFFSDAIYQDAKSLFDDSTENFEKLVE